MADCILFHPDSFSFFFPPSSSLPITLIALIHLSILQPYARKMILVGDSESNFPRVSGMPVRCGTPPICQALDIPTSTSSPPRRTHCLVGSEAAAATAKVEFEFAADDGSRPPLSNASSVSVRDGHVSGDPETEAEAVDMEDLGGHDQTATMVMIAMAKSWRAHASLLMLFVRYPLPVDKPRG